ncbi:phosphoribosyltransferase family protein [Mucilaginibacter xinganensis]|uniref:PRTase ComF-like n=1 Tax=Mucilaginibacter xinganensis TaxID=1234841 RepID=A0A223P370_9SPHI|nr:phosphoribosyltransferase family protein [Mucilaginibacter xinganensis]ASU36563.1 hypothetical protein MuYL_4680 [Mucilaginibacter xinganensis]
MNTTFSLHHIDNPALFGFNPDDYSRFKFGDDAVAKHFGTTLADGFIRSHLEQEPILQQIAVISSPYSFIPTATFAMKTWFVYRLNRWLAQNGYPVVQETKVHRTITYKEDYGELNAEERINLIGNDSFHIDKHFLAGKTLLFLDDIKITGSHERMIMKMVNAYGLQNDIYMLYFAELVNKSIHPNIENLLNYHQVKTIFDLEPIIKSGQFIINTRIVKYILNYNFECFRIFIENQDQSFVNLLYDMALGNGYHTIDAYAKNLNFITDNLFINNKNLIKHGN